MSVFLPARTIQLVEKRLNEYLSDHLAVTGDQNTNNQGRYYTSSISMVGSANGGSAFYSGTGSKHHHVMFKIEKDKVPKYSGSFMIFFYTYGGQMSPELKSHMEKRFKEEFGVYFEITTYYEFSSVSTKTVIKIDKSFFSKNSSSTSQQQQQQQQHGQSTSWFGIPANRENSNSLSSSSSSSDETIPRNNGESNSKLMSSILLDRISCRVCKITHVLLFVFCYFIYWALFSVKVTVPKNY